MSDKKIINIAFQNFVDEISKVRQNIEEEKEFSRGYLKCMSDILSEISREDRENLDNGIDDNYFVNMLIRKVDMDSRSKLIGELVPGLDKLLTAYKGEAD